MARDATARLYDVDEDSLVFKRFHQSKKYDYGTVTFRAREGHLIDLDKLHESIWATRLSGGTRSGLVSLEVTALGEVVVSEKETVLRVADSDASFVLAQNPDDGHQDAFDNLVAAARRGEEIVSVTGRMDGWIGRWPNFLQKVPPRPRRLLITSFLTSESQ